MAALKEAGGDTTDYPFFLRHTIGTNDIVTENYVGFVITSTMAQNNSGLTAGTYYIRGNDMYESDYPKTCKSEYIDSGTGDCMDSAYYNDNKATLLSAFGSTHCTDYSNSFDCYVSGLDASANTYGYVGANDGNGTSCVNEDLGLSYCGLG